MPHSGAKKGKKKARLTNRERGLIVVMLATWGSFEEVVEALGRDVPRQTIQAYDAGKLRNRGRLAGKWIRLFDDTRAAFLDNTRDVAISHRAFRLRELNRIFADGKRASDTDVQFSALREARAEYPHRAEMDIGISYDFVELPPDQIPEEKNE